MKADESGGDVLPGLGAGEDPGSKVLHILEPVQGIQTRYMMNKISQMEIYKMFNQQTMVESID